MSRDYLAIADQYCRDVIANKISANKYVKSACKRQIEDLKRWKKKSSLYQFDKERAIKACKFIELLPHIKGPLANQPIELAPWQVFILTTIFGWIGKDGKRRFRRVYIEVPRGNGKSALSSGVGLYMLAADGEGGAEVYSLATTRDQARIVFGDAQQMARKTAGLRSHFGVEVLAHNINVQRTASKFEALSAEGSTLDGLNIHFGCIDELHAHKTRAVYDVVETGTGKRDQSLLWVITTAGSNRSGICYEARTFVTKLLDQIFEDESQFGIVYGLDEGDDWTTEEALIKANPNWGVSVRPEVVLPLQQKAMQLPSATNNFKTKHLNEWVNADVAWMDMQSWDKCGNPALSIDDFAGQPCYIGLDLASKTDIAALVALFPTSDGKFAAFGKYYLPEDTIFDGRNSQYQGWQQTGRILATPGAVIDYEYIENDLVDLCTRFEVKEIPYDPWQATQLATRMVDKGLPMVEIRASVQNFSEPMKNLEALTLQGKLLHDGDPVLTWMVSNVVAHLDAKDNIYPRKERPENKIDGVVALIMALNRAQINAGEGPSVYEERGVLML